MLYDLVTSPPGEPPRPKHCDNDLQVQPFTPPALLRSGAEAQPVFGVLVDVNSSSKWLLPALLFLSWQAIAQTFHLGPTFDLGLLGPFSQAVSMSLPPSTCRL